MTNVDKPAELIIRLAQKEDRAKVDELRQARCLGSNWKQLSTDNDPLDGALLVACLPSSGKVVASVRLDLAETQDLLINQLGLEVMASNRQLPDHAVRLLWETGHEFDRGAKHLPTVTVARACAENTRYDRALRLACVRVVDFMHLDDRPVGSFMGVSLAKDPLVHHVATLGYDVSPVYWGEELFNGLHVAYRLRKCHFEQVITTLDTAQKAGSIPRYHWESAWPFQEHLPMFMRGK
ncbi:MAG: hypothetical protein ABI605_19765 [Rhizobacter sp.]